MLCTVLKSFVVVTILLLLLLFFLAYSDRTYIIHHFQVSSRGFSATCLQQMQSSAVEGLSQTATSGSQ